MQGFFAAQGLHGLHGFFAAHGLHGLQALGAQGLHVAIWIEVSAALDTAVGKAMAPVARVATLSAITVFLIIYASKESKPGHPATIAPEPTGSLMTPSHGPGARVLE